MKDDNDKTEPGDMVLVLKVTTGSGQIFYTDTWDDDMLRRIVARSDYQTHTVERMAKWQYKAIRGTGEAREFFK